MKSRGIDESRSLQWVLVEAGKRAAPVPEDNSAARQVAENLMLIRASARTAASARRLSRAHISPVVQDKALGQVTKNAQALKALVDLRPKPKEPKEDERFG